MVDISPILGGVKNASSFWMTLQRKTVVSGSFLINAGLQPARFLKYFFAEHSKTNASKKFLKQLVFAWSLHLLFTELLLLLLYFIVDVQLFKVFYNSIKKTSACLRIKQFLYDSNHFCLTWTISVAVFQRNIK